MKAQTNKGQSATGSTVEDNDDILTAGPDDQIDNLNGHTPARSADDRGIGFDEDRAQADSEEDIASDDEEDEDEDEDDDEFDDDEDTDDEDDDETEDDTETV